MISILKKKQLSLDEKDNRGFTPLRIMQNKKKTDCIIHLLCLGADPDIGDLDENAPLHVAVLVRFQ